MYKTHESDLHVLGGLALWMKNTAEVAIALPAYMMNNENLKETENTFQVFIIATEHFEGNLVRN